MRDIALFLFSLFDNLSGKLSTFRFTQNFPERPTLLGFKPCLLKEPKKRGFRIARLFSYPTLHLNLRGLVL